MSRTTTRRPGRLRALAVVGALAISMIAGAAAPAFAKGAPDHAPGADVSAEARDAAVNAPWNAADGNGVTTQGWSWF